MLVGSAATALGASSAPPDGARLTRTIVELATAGAPTDRANWFEISRDDGKGGLATEGLRRAQATNGRATFAGLEFGGRYSWREGQEDRKGKIHWSPSRAFEILSSPLVDPARFRVRVLLNALPPEEQGIVLLDHARVAIDRAGAPVWFLPTVPGAVEPDGLVRDVRPTADGTLTLLTERAALEIDIDGRVLWRAPEGAPAGADARGNDGGAGYHHAFAKLSTGSYMVLGNEYEDRPIAGDPDPIRVEYGTILEYAPDGELVWSWRSRDYYADEDLYSARPIVAMHLNAFDVDEARRIVYASFRDCSRIVAIDQRTGQVVDSYGTRMPSGSARTGDGLFHHQHAVTLLPGGDLLLFNNDLTREPGVVSSLVIFRPPPPGHGEAELVWRFPLDFDDKTDARVRLAGSVTVLPSGNLLVTMGQINRVFEVTRAGKVVWDAFVEKHAPPPDGGSSSDAEVAGQLRSLGYLQGGDWTASATESTHGSGWEPFPQYRATWSAALPTPAAGPDADPR